MIILMVYGSLRGTNEATITDRNVIAENAYISAHAFRKLSPQTITGEMTMSDERTVLSARSPSKTELFLLFICMLLLFFIKQFGKFFI